MFEIKHLILITLEDTVGRFLCYDRKEDQDLPRGAIEQAVKDGEITIDDMVALFRKELEAAVKRGGW